MGPIDTSVAGGFGQVEKLGNGQFKLPNGVKCEVEWVKGSNNLTFDTPVVKNNTAFQSLTGRAKLTDPSELKQFENAQKGTTVTLHVDQGRTISFKILEGAKQSAATSAATQPQSAATQKSNEEQQSKVSAGNVMEKVPLEDPIFDKANIILKQITASVTNQKTGKTEITSENREKVIELSKQLKDQINEIRNDGRLMQNPSFQPIKNVSNALDKMLIEDFDKSLKSFEDKQSSLSKGKDGMKRNDYVREMIANYSNIQKLTTEFEKSGIKNDQIDKRLSNVVAEYEKLQSEGYNPQ